MPLLPVGADLVNGLCLVAFFMPKISATNGHNIIIAVADPQIAPKTYFTQIGIELFN
jgi:hypothetical protein